MKKFLLAIILSFCFIIPIKAECSDQELNEWAKDLKGKMYLLDKEKQYDQNLAQYAYFLGLEKERNDIKIEIVDRRGTKVDATHYEDINFYGVGCFNGVSEDKYTINVYGNENSKCNGELIKSIEFTVPAYNEYYKSEYCKKYPNHELCAVFTNKTENMEFAQFKEIMTKYEEEQKVESNILLKIWELIKKYWIYIACIFVPIIAVTIYYKKKINNYKKLRNREIIRKKDKKKKIGLFIILLFLAIGRIDADFTCDEKITEYGFDGGGWDTVLPVCDWYFTGSYASPADGGDTVKGAKWWKITESAKWHDDLINITYANADGKGYSSGTVLRCEDDKRRYNINIRCYYTYEDYEWESYSCEKDCELTDEDGTKYWGKCPDTCQRKKDMGQKRTNCISTVGPKTVEEAEAYGTAMLNDVSFDNCSCGPGDVEDIDVFNEYVQAYTLEFEPLCQVWGCKRKNEVVNGWCNAAFSVRGQEAYCINPSDPFPNTGENNYSVDKNFDATKCESSYSTVDCGYANILIEGAYNSYSNAVINYALRLWAAYTGAQSGFDKIGLAFTQGPACDTWISFMRLTLNGEVNVYKQDVNYLLKLGVFEELTESRTGQEDSTPSSLINRFETMACNIGVSDDLLGVPCGGGAYKQAYALFLNTIMGNREMQNHLSGLFGGDSDTEPESAEVAASDEGKSVTIAVTYNEDITKGVKVTCNSIKNKNKASLTDQERKILEYCTNEVKYVVAQKDGKWIELLSGKEFNSEEELFRLAPSGGTSFDYCQKNACYIKVKYFATCDMITREKITDGVTIYVNYKQAPTKVAIKKYVYCGTTSDNYQTMFAFDKTPGIGTGGSYSEPWQTKEVEVDYDCYEGGCTDYAIKSDGENCSEQVGGYSAKTIKDPSLKCILNMKSSSEKKSHDYSEYFGVNTDFCRVYCSDSVEIDLASKVETYSGLSFKFDIEHQVFKKNKTDKALTSIVRLKRDCVSEIYYKDINFKERKDWSYKYEGVPNDGSVTNWKTLFNALKKYGKSDSHYRQVLYDLYNCNFYSDIPVKKPSDNAYGVLVDRIYDELYSPCNAYGIDSIDIDSNTTKLCKSGDSSAKDTVNNVFNNAATATLTYEGGAQLVDDSLKSMGRRAGSSTEDILFKSSNNTHVETNNARSDVVSEVKYCSGVNDCFRYKESDRASQKDYEIPAGGASKTEKVSYTNSQGNTVSYNVPANDYAYFSISTELGFYNDSKFQIQPYTGNVLNITGKTPVSNWKELEPYNYPVDIDAYKECDKGVCKYTNKLQLNNTYYRLPSQRDRFLDAVNKDNDVTCTFKVDTPPPDIGDPGDREIIYRSIQLSDLFIGDAEDDTRRENSNWKTEKAKLYTGEIESYVKNNSEIAYYNTHLEYSYSFTQSSLNKIRDYNEINGKYTYMDNTLRDCVLDEDGNYYECKSTFIDQIESNEAGFGVVNNREGEKRGVSKYTDDKLHNRR